MNDVSTMISSFPTVPSVSVLLDLFPPESPANFLKDSGISIDIAIKNTRETMGNKYLARVNIADDRSHH